MNKDDASELESEYRILRPPEERDINRIKPNPTVRVQPMFVETGPAKKTVKGKESKRLANGLCLEISGRVQHDDSELRHLKSGRLRDGGSWQGHEGEDPELSIDYN